MLFQFVIVNFKFCFSDYNIITGNAPLPPDETPSTSPSVGSDSDHRRKRRREYRPSLSEPTDVVFDARPLSHADYIQKIRLYCISFNLN